MNRRQFGENMLVILLANILITISGCGDGKPSSPTAPTTAPPVPTPPKPETVGLLTVVAAMPDYKSAQRVDFGNNGAARIAIKSDINWNFLIGDNTLSIGADVAPSLDASKIEIPKNADVRVRSF